MTPGRDEPGRGEPVERFHATSGRFVGLLSLAVIGCVVVYAVVRVHSVEGLRLATGALFFGVLVWITQLRPRAVAYRDVLRLQNSLRDVEVPFALIDDVHVGRMLTVWVGQERYVCVGIGAPLRTLVKGKKSGPGTMLGWERLEEYSRRSTPPPPEQVPVGYHEAVESRIAAMAQEARRRARIGGAEAGVDGPRPRAEWAWSGIVGLAVTGLAFAVSLLL